MARNAQPRGPPQGWAETILATAYRFSLYRTQETDGPLTAAKYAAARQDWMQYEVGRRQQIALRDENISPWNQYMILRGARGPDLDRPAPKRASKFFKSVQRKLSRVKGAIAPIENLQYIKALGYGGNGLVVKIKETKKKFDFVLKVSLDNWESPAIRKQERHGGVQKVNRAAHCIQMIPRNVVGVISQRPFAWECPDEDDSSDSGESSGEESRAESPGPGVRRSRSPKNADERNADVAKRAAHQYRIRTANEKIRRRRDGIRRRRQQKVPTPNEPDDPDFEERRGDVMLLEFCENGDLRDLLYRLNEADATVPNRVLWGFWLCMVRSCVAMQYPPRKFHPRRREEPRSSADGVPIANNSLEGKTVGHDLYEDIPPPRRRWAEKRHVHFDIDSQNILITGLDIHTADNEHKIIPRLKLADFGLAREVKPRKRKSNSASIGILYGHATAGPRTHHQISSGAEISREPVAGNYGPHTNVWQIALVAWQLMTEMEAPLPPQLQPKSGPHANLPYNYCPAILGPDFDHYDVELRETIARCMAHDPRDRPPLGQLLEQAKDGIDKRFANEPDTFIMEWVQTFIYNP